jgi:hypothetical protein
MKRRVWVCIGLMIWSELLAGNARAQVPSSPVTTSSLLTAKQAPDATAFRPQIEQFIQTQMDALADPATLKAARESLIKECSADANPSYLNIYSKAINAAAKKLLSTNPPLHVRLNIAVVLNEVGKSARTSEIEDAVLMLVNDAAEPVVLRGLQAAHPVITSILLNNPTKATGDKLIAAILPAVKSHPKSGLIASEAYHALLPDDGLPAGVRVTTDALVLAPILDLLDYRISLYTTTIPDNPAAENEIPTFIYHSFKNAGALQHRAVQALVNLIAVVGRQATNATKVDIAEMVQTLNYSASALSTNIPAVQGILAPIATLSKSTLGPAVAQRVAPIFGQLQPLLPYLKPPPTVVPATTQP